MIRHRLHGPRDSCLSTVLDRWCVRLLVASALAVGAPALAQDVFLGDFETGSVHPWSDAIGLAESLFRFRDLDLRDPHIFVDASPFGCIDVTDKPFLLVPALNPTLEDMITMDGDGDNLLDTSPLLVFLGGLVTTAEGGLVDSAAGVCTAPVESTACTVDAVAPRTELLADGQAAGTCLEALAGTTSGYSPPVGSTPGPCFVTRAQDLPLDLGGGLSFPLRSAQIAATFVEAPPTALASGWVRGFLSESDADQILLPAELGGAVLSSLLPGGTGSCAPGDDRDLLVDVSGWWFYFEFEALPVPFSP